MRIEHDRGQIESELFAISLHIRKSRNARPENIGAISASAPTAGAFQLARVSQLTFWLMAPCEKWDARGPVLRASPCGDGAASCAWPRRKDQGGVALGTGRES